MNWLLHNWTWIACTAAWTYLVGSFCWLRGHQVGWYRGYLARKHEETPDEFWPQGLSEKEGLRRARMLDG